MKHFGDLLFQLMKHGTNTLHVVLIFFVPCERYGEINYDLGLISSPQVQVKNTIQ